MNMPHSRVKVGASAHMIMYEALIGFFLAEIFDRVRPENIAHEPMSGRFSETINL
jgi:hypothetical protein